MLLVRAVKQPDYSSFADPTGLVIKPVIGWLWGENCRGDLNDTWEVVQVDKVAPYLGRFKSPEGKLLYSGTYAEAMAKTARGRNECRKRGCHHSSAVHENKKVAATPGLAYTSGTLSPAISDSMACTANSSSPAICTEPFGIARAGVNGYIVLAYMDGVKVKYRGAPVEDGTPGCLKAHTWYRLENREFVKHEISKPSV